ncbi:NAD-dependent epimerase/dehydratase family protein [Sphingopyxis sp.]|uniref:UDP-2-acetamido-2,6-beta-L-arabino-hexul-4-ose reductase n=1 Tax=Sphingopyxis sp. TaxID=1908224 RepID=UPI0025E3C5F1|nr:NAD-dependent epimerase/dehydratase family protein [Sphingopyxis sp.]
MRSADVAKILITGADGFLGRNLRLLLAERADVEVATFTRADSPGALADLLADVGFIFHLAGVNRPENEAEFAQGNIALTEALCAAVRASGRAIPVIYTSSIQAMRDNSYGESKRGAEEALARLQAETGNPVFTFRLPNVFGKWARPNYNSAVATFCHNIARGLPIHINDPASEISLAYVDDVLSEFVAVMDGATLRLSADGFAAVHPVYQITVGELADTVRAFAEGKNSLLIDRVGTGLTRALYATYVSYLPTDAFSYTLPMHGDARGVFVEMLKTIDSGQFSYFTAHPGVTRGGHYHHTKTEKFLVIKGRARFKFRHMDSGEIHSLDTDGSVAEIVETVPGWTHDITNIGEDEMVVMIWANEIFDRMRPDTFACPL